MKNHELLHHGLKVDHCNSRCLCWVKLFEWDEELYVVCIGVCVSHSICQCIRCLCMRLSRVGSLLLLACIPLPSLTLLGDDQVWWYSVSELRLGEGGYCFVCDACQASL